MAYYSVWTGVALYFTILFSAALAQDPLCYNQSAIDTSKDLPYLQARFPSVGVKTPRGNPFLGHQNETYCCMQAVEEWLKNGCQSNSQILIDRRILEPGAQFPCGAKYIGDNNGAAEVQVTYDWTAAVCPGWQISEASNVNQWAQLLVSFVLPAVVFSFNIPRPRKLRVWKRLFPADIGNYRMITGLLGAIGAAICVTIDTVVWLMFCFAFAAPLLISGLYEAHLDKRVINYLDEYIKHDDLPIGLRARIMFTILCGNLDLYPAWSDSMDLARELDDLDKVQPTLSITSTDKGGLQDTSMTQHERSATIDEVVVRLRDMLACQSSFGSTIGGPVVFFLGSFIYAMLEIKQTYGDEDIAEALAFGMWWMIIPHIAAVAGLLLAGNNPNILEGIVGIRELRYEVGESLERHLERRSTIVSIANIQTGRSRRAQDSSFKLLEKVYEAQYTPAWMYDRGRCKQDWLLVLFTDSWFKYQKNGRLPPEIRKGLKHFLNDAVMLKMGDWLFLWIFAFMLIFIPCLFGFLTAYYTPEVGVACRSMTFLTYMSAQTILLILWTLRLTWRDKYWVLSNRVHRCLQTGATSGTLEEAIDELHKQASADTTAPKLSAVRRGSAAFLSGTQGDDQSSSQTGRSRTSEVIFFGTCIVASAMSLFSSIGGSLMEIIGIYRNCLCRLTVDHWGPVGRSTVFLTLSTNTYEDIKEGRRHWVPIGACSVVFLGLVCYIGWWYQRRLREAFGNVAIRLDGDPEQVEQELEEVARGN